MEPFERWPQLLSRCLNRPLLIHPDKAEMILAAISERTGVSQIVRINGDVHMLSPMVVENESQPLETYSTHGYEVEMGVAHIEIEGTLVHKLCALRPYSGMTGYDGIRQNFVSAMLDPKVRAVMLDIDSPGGEVSGCFDLVDMIASQRGRKPIWAVLNECAYSAAYAIACAADHITVPRTGGSGSIGAIFIHCDMSKAIAGAGLKVTVFAHGSKKSDGYPEIPLSESARETYQRDIDAIGDLFDNTVARYRGLQPKQISDMQAGTFLGAEGVALNLVDEVLAPDAAFRALVDSLG